MPFKADKSSSRFTPDAPEEPTIGEKAGAGLYGAATGLVGGAGEFEKFVADDIPEYLGFRDKEETEKFRKEGGVFGTGRATIAPTIEEAQSVLGKVGIKKPREEVSGYQTAGEILGGLGTSLPGLIKGGVKTLLGTPSKTSEYFAKIAEDLGFKLSPSQVRQDIPLAEKGATGWAKENQTLANNLATEGTGEKTAEVTSDFIGNRLKKLGADYDKLYKGKEFAVEGSVVDALNNILAKEQELGVAGVTTVKQAAQTMLNKIEKDGLVVAGEDLQRLRNALTEKARGSSNRGNAHEIYEFVNIIDDSVAAKNPALREALSELNPKYRNSIILEDLYRQGGIKQGNVSLEKLGIMLRGKRDAVRRNKQDIDGLAELGRELGLRARWETAGRSATAGEDLLGKALGTGADIASVLTGTRSRPARALQRYYEKNPTLLPPKVGKYVPPGLPAATAAGTATRPLQD